MAGLKKPAKTFRKGMKPPYGKGGNLTFRQLFALLHRLSGNNLAKTKNWQTAILRWIPSSRDVVVPFVSRQPLENPFISSVTFAEFHFGNERQNDPARPTQIAMRRITVCPSSPAAPNDSIAAGAGVFAPWMDELSTMTYLHDPCRST